MKPIGAQSETVGGYGSIEPNERTAVFSERVRLNQQKLRADLKSRYHLIVCGSGSSGSVVAARLAENPDVNVLLLEAGGDDDVPSVMDATLWPTNIGTERDWQFQAQSNPSVNGRSIPLGMGKVLGGGSSINGMLWSHGHKNDWDFFASETGDPAWSYESVLNIYRRIEDWHGGSGSKVSWNRGTCLCPTYARSTPCWLSSDDA